MSAFCVFATCTWRILHCPYGQPRYPHSSRARQAVCAFRPGVLCIRAGIYCTCANTVFPTRARPQTHRHRQTLAPSSRSFRMRPRHRLQRCARPPRCRNYNRGRDALLAKEMQKHLNEQPKQNTASRDCPKYCHPQRYFDHSCHNITPSEYWPFPFWQQPVRHRTNICGKPQS